MADLEGEALLSALASQVLRGAQRYSRALKRPPVVVDAAQPHHERHAHVLQQLGVESGAEVAHVAHVKPGFVFGRQSARRFEEENFLRDSAVNLSVLRAAQT
jgi:hypothetical protein